MNKKYTYTVGETYNIVRLVRLFRENNIEFAETECVLCGKRKTMKAYCLYNNNLNSCSCRTRKHGMSGSKIYSIYHNMKDRCYNEMHHEYKNYGGKGVYICDDWLWSDGFVSFYRWAEQNGYIEGLSIDRIDSNGPYSPENCRWITVSENTARANKGIQHRKANKGTYYGVSPDNIFYEFDNANKFSVEHGLNPGSVRRAANGKMLSYKGWKFGFLIELNTNLSNSIDYRKGNQ